jgi:hypothetical protein
LEIDHIDPKKKAFSISSQAPNEKAFREELEKCQLLCKPHHREKTSREWSGARHPLAKLTSIQVAEIRAALKAGESGRYLARRFGVHPMQISRIKHRTRWANEAN